MLDFTNIPNPENYAGMWVAFVINELAQTVEVIASAHSISELTQLAGSADYIIHKF